MVAASPRSSADEVSGDEPEGGSARSELAQDDPTQDDLTQCDPDADGDLDVQRVHPHGVDPYQEPSVEWGWHGGFPRASRIAGWFTAAALFFMLIGNHENNVENWWLIGLGTGLVVLLVADELKRRSSWRS